MTVNAVIPWESETPIEVRLSVTGLECWCPINRLKDKFSLCLTYVPNASLIELGWFRRMLNEYADRRLTHEQVTIWIFDLLIELFHPTRLDLVTIWAPVEGVECSVKISAGE